MEEIINNIMQSPENTNPNVLRSQLQNIEGGSGGVLVVTVVPAGDGQKKGDTKSSQIEALIADKTVAEIREAMLSSGAVLKIQHAGGEAELEDVFSVIAVIGGDKGWSVFSANVGGGTSSLVADSLDDYPKSF